MEVQPNIFVSLTSDEDMEMIEALNGNHDVEGWVEASDVDDVELDSDDVVEDTEEEDPTGVMEGFSDLNDSERIVGLGDRIDFVKVKEDGVKKLLQDLNLALGSNVRQVRKRKKAQRLDDEREESVSNESDFRCLCWNSRGSHSEEKARVVRRLVRKHRPMIVGLQETKRVGFNLKLAQFFWGSGAVKFASTAAIWF